MKISWEHRYIYYLYGLNWELLCIFILHYYWEKYLNATNQSVDFSNWTANQKLRNYENLRASMGELLSVEIQ